MRRHDDPSGLMAPERDACATEPPREWWIETMRRNCAARYEFAPSVANNFVHLRSKPIDSQFKDLLEVSRMVRR